MPAAKAADGAVKIDKVAKASGPNAKTVAEVVGGKTALKDKRSSCAARWVKVNLGILGKNWVHLRDGSGWRRTAATHPRDHEDTTAWATSSAPMAPCAPT